MPFSIEAKRLGLTKEGTRLAVEAAPDTWIPILPETELDYSLEHIEDRSVRGVADKRAPAAGIKSVTGNIDLQVQASIIGEILQMLLGDPSSSQVADQITITSGSNDEIDFSEGSGSLNATLTAATYTPDTLATEVASKMTAAAVATITCVFDDATGKFTIASDGGTFELEWKTGTNGSDGNDTHAGTTLGYDDAADDTGSTSYAGDNVVTVAYNHLFAPTTTIQLPTYSIWLDRGLNTQVYNGCGVSKITLEAPVDGDVTMKAEIMGLTEATEDIGSPTYTESGILTFQHSTVKVAGSADDDVKDWNLSIDNGMQAKRGHRQSQDAHDVLASGKVIAAGAMTVWFEDVTERDKFLANTNVSLQFTVAGETIAGSIKYTLDINVYASKYKAFPYTTEEGILAAKVEWEGYYSTSDSKALNFDLKNAKDSY